MRDIRVKHKFPIRLAVDFFWSDRSERKAGSGLVIEMSSDSIAVVTGSEPPAFAHLEASIAWPAALEDGCPLRLVVAGQVVATAGKAVEIQFDRYEFRTASRAPRPAVTPGTEAPALPPA
jgi:hypothetical protein